MVKWLTCALLLSIYSIGQMAEGNYTFSDGFEGGINYPWINEGWTLDRQTPFEGEVSARSPNGQLNSNLSIRMHFPCTVSFKGKRMYPGSELRFLDNNITASRLSDPLICGWEEFTWPIGEDYSIITSAYLHELRWWGIRAAWLDDVNISSKPYLQLDGKATPINCTSEDNITYNADIKSNIYGVDVELIIAPPSIYDNSEISLGVKRFENASLNWGPIKLDCTNVGMGKFYFKIGSPFNKNSNIYNGPNVEICAMRKRFEPCPNAIGTIYDCFRYCTDIISSTNATIEFFGSNNEIEPWFPLGYRKVNNTKQREPLCINCSYALAKMDMHRGFMNHGFAGE